MAKIKVGKEIRFPINGVSTPGYLALPDTIEPVPGIIVVQEVWGLNDDIKRIAREFAEGGYAALAPDLYHGQVSIDLEEARKIHLTMAMDRAIKDIDASIKYLKGLPEVNGNPVGMIGFCMGGGLTLESAIRGADIAAGLCFYGGTQTDDASLRKIAIPIFGAFGEEDHLISVESVEKMRNAFVAGNVDHEVRIYPGAGHSFFNEVKPEWYRPEQTKEAWSHIYAFLSRTLQGNG